MTWDVVVGLSRGWEEWGYLKKQNKKTTKKKKKKKKKKTAKNNNNKKKQESSQVYGFVELTDVLMVNSGIQINIFFFLHKIRCWYRLEAPLARHYLCVLTTCFFLCKNKKSKYFWSRKKCHLLICIIIICRVHHNLFITPLLGSIAWTVLVKQPCYIQTKMYRLYWKMTIYGHFFNIIYTFLGSIFELYYIQTKMYRFYWKMTIYGHFSIQSIHFLEPIFEPCYIQNRVITNRVIKRL